MGKLYYTVGEVADMLNENTSTIRFWANKFTKFIKPDRNKKGNRLFRDADIDVFREIQFLAKNEGLTLDGVEKRLEHDRGEAARRIKVLDSLNEIREQLYKVKSSL